MKMIFSILFDRPVKGFADKFDIKTITFTQENKKTTSASADITHVTEDETQPCTLHFHLIVDMPSDTTGITNIDMMEGDHTTSENTLPKPVIIQDIRFEQNDTNPNVEWDFSNYVFHQETAISQFKTVSTHVCIEFDFDADIAGYDPKRIDLLGLAKDAAIRELISELQSETENDYNKVRIVSLSKESCIGE